MISLDLLTVFVLALACVPIVWMTPKEFAFDAVAAWTLICLAFLSPASAIWLLSIAVFLPLALSFGQRRKVAVTIIFGLILLGAFVGARVSPGWAWIGGAFFTLRALHVVIEWWMGRHEAPTLRESLQYFLFLPVLAAGPINRFPHFQHQLRRRRWDAEMFFTGAERILLGLVWLYFVAGRVLRKVRFELSERTADLGLFWQVWVDSVIDWVALFFVFAGATHLALGIALMMGLKLEENFNRPWSARTLADFWKRWHMSLSNWVLDYVFRPVSALTRQPVIALVAAMLVIGLWHAFTVYYVLWAVWQSLGIVISRILVSFRVFSWMPKWAALVLGPVVVLAWLSASRPVIEAVLGVLA